MPSFHIALVMPFWLEYTNLLMEGVVSYVRDHPEIKLSEFPLQGSPWTQADKRPFPFDGVVTFANVHNDRWVLDLCRDAIPVVNCSSDFLNQPLPCVAGSGCADVAADYLVDLGREHVAFVYGAAAAEVFVDSHHRPLVEALQPHGMEVHRFAHQPSQPDMPYESLSDPGQEEDLAQFLVELPKPAAVWCLSDYLGGLVLRVARHTGVGIPVELAVLGVGDYRVGRAADPPLSTIPVPGTQIGAKAMSLLHEIIRGRLPKDSGRFVIPCPAVIERGSTSVNLLGDNLAGQADALMREYACEGLNVNELAGMLGVSRVTLTKRVQAAFGVPPSQKLRDLRVEKAQQWLSVEGLKVARIASMCGFSEQGKFYNFFKRETGLSPTEFRHKLGNSSPA